MPQDNLLVLTQLVLSSIDGNAVSSIDDTPESQQVVKIIKTAYYDIINRADLPSHYDLTNLTESNATTPVLMTLPSTVQEIMWLKYDNATSEDTDLQMRVVTYQPLAEFLARADYLDESDSTVDSMTYTGSGTAKFLFSNNKFPQYYTTFDNNTLVFDSYDSTEETYLQAANTLAYVKLAIPWTESNTFVPDLDEVQFSLLINEAKSLAWAELRQAQHAKAEQAAHRGWTTIQRRRHRTEDSSELDKLPNYGRN